MSLTLNKNQEPCHKKLGKEQQSQPNFFQIFIPYNNREEVIDHRGGNNQELDKLLKELRDRGIEINTIARSPCG